MRRIVLLGFCLMLFASWGCQKKASVPVPAPPVKSNLEKGEADFRAGRYSQAARAFEAYVKSNLASKDRDKALFYLGLSRAISGVPTRDLHQAEASWKQLIAEFTNSQYKSEAEYILKLQAQMEKLSADVSERDAQIKQLRDELQKLKEIDMQRRPPRPPGSKP
jgi:outer membrane protein assembly factor BamD (BamD/ComL family)